MRNCVMFTSHFRRDRPDDGFLYNTFDRCLNAVSMCHLDSLFCIGSIISSYTKNSPTLSPHSPSMESTQIVKRKKIDSISRLPVDVFFDIFSKLPLKTVSRCRWVCKTWYSLILHPRFAPIHYARSLQNNSPCLFLRDVKNNYFLIDHEVFDNFEISASAYNFKAMGSNKMLRAVQGFTDCDVVGSANGLICFSPEYEYFYICNPITGEYIRLPDSPKNNVKPIVCGFGYNSASDDYKLIRILRKSVNIYEAEVYTLGPGSWGMLENVPNVTHTRPFSVVLNGNLHWMTYENGSKFIISFNVATEEFNAIQLPFYRNKHKNIMFDSLGVLGEHLCLIDDHIFMDQEVWVMKEYGIPESWTKDFVFESKDSSICRFWHGSHQLIQLSDGTLLFLNHKRQLVYFDPLTRNFRPILIKNPKNDLLLQIRNPTIEVGSLISPKHVGHH